MVRDIAEEVAEKLTQTMWRQYERERAAHLVSLYGPKPEHGTRKEYERGCRCDECKRGYYEYGRKYNNRTKGVPKRKRKHGTIYMYNQGCRCAFCKQEAASYHAFRRRLQGIPKRLTHGRESTYNRYGCRCDRCKEAKKIARREQRARAREQSKQAVESQSTSPEGESSLGTPERID